MKKITALIIVLLIMITSKVYAGNTGGILVEPVEPYINEVNNEISLKVYLGNLNELKKEAMGFSLKLNFNKALVELVKVEGQSGWNAEYSQESNIIYADVTQVEENTQILVIKIKLQDDLKDDCNVKIQLQDMYLTDGEKEITCDNQEYIFNYKTEESLDTTTSNNMLPFAGMNKVIFTTIVLMCLIIFFKFKSRKIKY